MATDWPSIRAGIFAGESGGDYNALFGFSNRPGGRFANTRLTDMTVDQALNFASPSGPYGQWVKGKIGRVATPMGGFQVVGTTLKAAKEGLGLSGNERMTPETQDKLGQWIMAKQGTGAWEGYRGPRDPSSFPAAAPTLSPEAADFVKNNPQPGGFGLPVEQAAGLAPATQQQPQGGILADLGTPQDVADHWNSLPDDGSEKQSPLQKMFALLAKTPEADPVRFSQMGDARATGDSLLKAVNAPRFADLLKQKRMG